MLKSHSFPDEGFFSGLAGKSLVVTLWTTRPRLGNYVIERCRQKASPLLCGNVNVGVRLSTRPCCIRKMLHKYLSFIEVTRRNGFALFCRSLH